MIHADLRPELISVPFRRGQNFRILDRLGDPSPPSQVQLNNFRSQKALYMSPQVFRSLCSRQRKVKHNPFKSDVFSLGMVLLEAGLLDSVQNVYDRARADIDESALVGNVERFFQRHPGNFVLQEMLLTMLEFGEDLRQEPIKLLRTLRRLQKSAQCEELPGAAKAGAGDPEASRGMDVIRVTKHCFGIREDLLQNVSFLYGLSKTPRPGSRRENKLKKSLVEMLRKRTSHNLPPHCPALVEFRRQAAQEEPSDFRSEIQMGEYGIQVSGVKELTPGDQPALDAADLRHSARHSHLGPPNGPVRRVQKDFPRLCQKPSKGTPRVRGGRRATPRLPRPKPRS